MFAPAQAIQAKKTYWTAKRIIFTMLIIYAFAIAISLPVLLMKWFA